LTTNELKKIVDENKDLKNAVEERRIIHDNLNILR
jgi:hypothetical protein